MGSSQRHPGNLVEIALDLIAGGEDHLTDDGVDAVIAVDDLCLAKSTATDISEIASSGDDRRGKFHASLLAPMRGLVEPRGIEPLTFALRTRRSPS